MANLSILMTLSHYRGYGGHEIVINNLCKGLTELGYDPVIGAFSFAEDPPAGIRKIDLSRLQKLGYNDGTSFDIIHNHQTILNYYSLFSSRPFVFHYHGAANRAQEINLKLSFMLCKKRISKIISVSNSGAKRLEEILGETNVQVLYNGVDLTSFNANLPRPHTKGDPQLLFVGVLYPTKNALFLVETMPDILRIYPNAHLQIIGEGAEYSLLEELIRRRGLENKIELVGKLTGQELPLWYSSCDIYLSASTKETLPLPPLESLACGKPVLLSNIPPHKEIIDASHGGLAFALGNKCDLVQKLDQVYNGRSKFSINGRTFAERHSWPEICKRLSVLYKDVVS